MYERTTIFKNVPMPTAGLSLPIDVTGYVSGSIRVPSVWTAADIAFFAAEEDNLFKTTENQIATPPVYALVRDKAGAIVRITPIQTAEAGWYEIPAAALAHRFIKIQSTNTASGAAVTQGAIRPMVVALKS